MRYVYMGTPEFAVPTLRALVAAGLRPEAVLTQPPMRRSRRGHEEHSPVGEAARALGLPVVEAGDVSTGEALELLRTLRPDLIVVVAFGQILRKDVLALPCHGCINLHPSMLPAYRGAAPVQRTIIDGVTHSGITVMKIVAKLDAGPVLMQRPFDVLATETAEEALTRAAQAGASMMVEAVQTFVRGAPLAEQPQDDSLATYAAMLTKEDGRIDFSQPATAVWNRIRGVTPWPRASTFYPHGQELRRLIIHRAALTGKASAAAPGTILALSSAGIEVACAGDTLLLTQVQAEGRGKCAAQEFAKGARLEIGQCLTQEGRA